MKYYLLLFLGVFSFNAFSQNIATLPDGRKVILKSDGTWQYENAWSKESSTTECNSSVENLPKIHKTIDRLKNHVAVENNCSVENIKVISFAQGRGDGMYSLCVNGKIMKYKMIGTVFMKADEDPFQSKK